MSTPFASLSHPHTLDASTYATTSPNAYPRTPEHHRSLVLLGDPCGNSSTVTSCPHACPPSINLSLVADNQLLPKRAHVPSTPRAAAFSQTHATSCTPSASGGRTACWALRIQTNPTFDSSSTHQHGENLYASLHLGGLPARQVCFWLLGMSFSTRRRTTSGTRENQESRENWSHRLARARKSTRART